MYVSFVASNTPHIKAPRIRKPAEVVEVELDQLRAQLQKELRERRRDARRRRHMRRRCRLQVGRKAERGLT